ncbi:tyrosine-type recombinase/integrase [Robinsoniella peoriensis]|uniref:tyrosine-type recombinase/integrase n=1 Tax=Robinsoniella peoriensis TaxID=180332 RepID=UPI003640BC6E
MAKDKNGKELPKGITWREREQSYYWRFQLSGENYSGYEKRLPLAIKSMNDTKYEVEHGLYAKETNITVDSWYKVWIEEYKPLSVKKGTIIIYDNAYNNYMKKELGKKKLKDVRPEHIQKLYNELSKTLSRNTIQTVSQILNGMYKQAIDNGMVLKNPAANVKKPKAEERADKVILSEEQQSIFLDAAKDHYLYTMIKLALFTGMRSGELRSLQWEDIDFENSIVKVRHTLKYTVNTSFFFDSPKTKTSKRDIPMLSGVKQLLKSHKKQQAEQRMLLGKKWRPMEGFEHLVFASRFGRPIQNTTFNSELKQICQSLQSENDNFPVISPHSLRHTFATRGLENGIKPKVMQTILGHSTLSMTMDLYAHVLPNAKAEELEKLANLF